MHSKGLRYSMFSIYSILLAMCASMELYFTWKLPISFCKCNVCLFFTTLFNESSEVGFINRGLFFICSLLDL